MGSCEYRLTAKETAKVIRYVSTTPANHQTGPWPHGDNEIWTSDNESFSYAGQWIHHRPWRSSWAPYCTVGTSGNTTRRQEVMASVGCVSEKTISYFHCRKKHSNVISAIEFCSYRTRSRFRYLYRLNNPIFLALARLSWINMLSEQLFVITRCYQVFYHLKNNF